MVLVDFGYCMNEMFQYWFGVVGDVDDLLLCCYVGLFQMMLDLGGYDVGLFGNFVCQWIVCGVGFIGNYREWGFQVMCQVVDMGVGLFYNFMI